MTKGEIYARMTWFHVESGAGNGHGYGLSLTYGCGPYGGPDGDHDWLTMMIYEHDQGAWAIFPNPITMLCWILEE